MVAAIFMARMSRVPWSFGGGSQNRNSRCHGALHGGGFVPGHLEQVLARPDEGDRVLGGGSGEVRILGQEPVTRVDSVGAGDERNANELGDIEVGADGVA
jgi:hypothetical protein